MLVTHLARAGLRDQLEAKSSWRRYRLLEVFSTRRLRKALLPEDARETS